MNIPYDLGGFCSLTIIALACFFLRSQCSQVISWTSSACLFLASSPFAVSTNAFG